MDFSQLYFTTTVKLSTTQHKTMTKLSLDNGSLVPLIGVEKGWIFPTGYGRDRIQEGILLSSRIRYGIQIVDPNSR